jgi:DNA topoisomerase-3
MIVVLAEKPSVARDIAAVLGASQKRNGYFEGNNYQVTYAFGHLVTIAEPEQMNPAWGGPWKMEQLPMIPSKWLYRVADKAQEQFDCIKKLFLHPATTGIICATDAGREGQHIFDLIYQLTGSTKPVQRLWISSLTPEAIRAGFRDLKPASAFANLSAAAAWRARADWLVGLSATRAYTVINGQTCTVGRVQTPTLALIVNRQNAIDSFKPTPFYEIHVLFEPGFTAKYITVGEGPQTRLQDRAAAQAILDHITPIANGSVGSVTTTEKITKAPALFDLLTLQKESNKRFGYTAQETLDIAQSLYEEYKLFSYPRVCCRPHTRGYVLMSVMLSCSTRTLWSKESGPRSAT